MEKTGQYFGSRDPALAMSIRPDTLLPSVHKIPAIIWIGEPKKHEISIENRRVKDGFPLNYHRREAICG